MGMSTVISVLFVRYVGQRGELGEGEDPEDPTLHIPATVTILSAFPFPMTSTVTQPSPTSTQTHTYLTSISNNHYNPPKLKFSDYNYEINGSDLFGELEFVTSLEKSEESKDMKFDVSSKNPDPSDVRLIHSQNLVHDSKVGLALSGGGFGTKNSKNLRNFTKNSLTDSSSVQVIPKQFFFTFLNFVIPMVFLVVNSSHKLHFSHYFLFQQHKDLCSS
jgi:hypothetical protein